MTNILLDILLFNSTVGFTEIYPCMTRINRILLDFGRNSITVLAHWHTTQYKTNPFKTKSPEIALSVNIFFNWLHKITSLKLFRLRQSSKKVEILLNIFFVFVESIILAHNNEFQYVNYSSDVFKESHDLSVIKDMIANQPQTSIVLHSY